MARLVVFLMVLEIFNNESVNSTFEYKLEYKFEYKLGEFNTLELVPDITDYKLEFMTQKFKNVTSFFLTQFNLKLVKNFLNDLP